MERTKYETILRILCDKRIHRKMYQRFSGILESRTISFPKKAGERVSGRELEGERNSSIKWTKRMRLSMRKGNIYSQEELCTQSMHSNMYLMHNKNETSKKTEITMIKMNTAEEKKKCEKHDVQCIYHIRLTDKCFRYFHFFLALFLLQ